MNNLFASLELGRRALQASRLALDVAGHNIANVNTPGYSRRRVELVETPPLFLGRLFAGTGVATERVVRVVDRLLHAQVRSEEEAFGRSRAAAEGLGRVEALLGEAGGAGISQALSNFYGAFSALAGTPDDGALRRGAVASADALAGAVRSRARGLVEERRRIDAAATTSVARIGDLARDIAELNRRIQLSEPGAVEASALRDARSLKLRELSALVDVQVAEGPAGTVLVSLAATGDALVIENAAIDLQISRDGAGLARVEVRRSGVLVDVTDKIRGGKLGGELRLRDETVRGYLDRLDTLASDLIARVNAAHAAGVDGAGNPGGNLFVPTAPGASAAATLTVSAAILADPRLLAAGTTASPGDGSNALAIAALENAASAALGNRTSAAYYADLQMVVGVDARGALSALDTGRAALLAAEERLQALSGVDLDEEAAALLQYQRSYEAAAKFIAVVNDMTRAAIEAFTR